MKIAASSLSMSASYMRTEQFSQRERLELWRDRRQSVDISEGGRARQRADEQAALGQSGKTENAGKVTDEDEQELSPQLQMIKQMVEYLTGRSVRVFRPQDLQADTADISQQNAALQQAAARQNGEAPPAGWGARYEVEQSYSMSQVMQFQAEGTIVTEDGQAFSFRAELLLAQNYSEHSSASISLGDAARPKKDPLVINYAAPAAQLREQLQSFDVDADGQAEQIQTLAAGSGWLALDRNGDGQVNDGSELFGTRSGDGFADLAAHDEDGNGWIDENDAVYGQLRLWVQEGGSGPLLTLREADVGAIFLGKVASPFQLGNSPQAAGGEIAATGLFLRDSGGAGTAQQVDLYA